MLHADASRQLWKEEAQQGSAACDSLPAGDIRRVLGGGNANP